jgi:two-component system LytT family sensor kinase
MASSLAEQLQSDQDDAPRLRWPVVLLVFTVLGVVRFNTFFLDDLTRDQYGTFATRLIEEITGTYGAMLLFPLIVAAERRYPLTLGRWRPNWPAHLAAFVVYSAIHTSLLAVSRKLIFPAVGLGAYDYGRMSVRYFMEASTDILAFSVFLGTLTMLRMQNRARRRELRAAALERDAANARLESLSLQLQPHFLFNALNTISSTVYDDPTAADEMIGRLGDLLRHSLRTTGRQEITVDEELSTLRAYLTFVDARFGDRLHVVLDVDPSTNDLAIPAFMLQPLVENAVRHGAAAEYQAAGIRIALSRRVAQLEIVVENDVHAIPDEPLQVGTGLGTTRDRLRLLYGDAATLETSVEAGRFRMIVRLPARALAPTAMSIPVEEHAGAHR